jgi:hypothetical protein
VCEIERHLEISERYVPLSFLLENHKEDEIEQFEDLCGTKVTIRTLAAFANTPYAQSDSPQFR